MAWMIGIATYIVLLTGVLLIAGGRRRGDMRHAAAVKEMTESEVIPQEMAKAYQQHAVPAERAAAGQRY